MKPVILKTQILKRTETPFTNKALYEFQPQQKWQWLQRACFRVLDWIGAHHQETIETISIEVAPQDIIRHLMAQIDTVRLFHEGGPTRVMMGPRNFNGLRNRPDSWHYIELPRINGEMGYGNEVRVFGLDVTIVPWLDGVLVLP